MSQRKQVVPMMTNDVRTYEKEKADEYEKADESRQEREISISIDRISRPRSRSESNLTLNPTTTPTQSRRNTVADVRSLPQLQHQAAQSSAVAVRRGNTAPLPDLPAALSCLPPNIASLSTNSYERQEYERQACSVLGLVESICAARDQYACATAYYGRLQYWLSTPALCLGLVVTMGSSLQLDSLPAVKYSVALLAGLNTLLVALMQHWKVEAMVQAHHDTALRLRKITDTHISAMRPHQTTDSLDNDREHLRSLWDQAVATNSFIIPDHVKAKVQRERNQKQHATVVPKEIRSQALTGSYP